MNTQLTQQDKATVWKPVKGYEGLYDVSACGLVKSLRTERYDRMINNDGTLRPKCQYGYLKVGLCKDGTCKQVFVHRLVAQSFVENHLNAPFVNHIDGDKQNNYVANLEWVTQKQNIRHSFDMGLQKPIYKPVYVFDKTMKFLFKIESVKSTALHFGIGQPAVSNAIRHGYYIHHKYKVSFDAGIAIRKTKTT